MTQKAFFDPATGQTIYVDLTPAEQAAYDAQQTANATLVTAAQTAASQTATAVAADKAQVGTFMAATSGTATAAQRDDTIKAIVRYLRRRGDDA